MDAIPPVNQTACLLAGPTWKEFRKGMYSRVRGTVIHFIPILPAALSELRAARETIVCRSRKRLL
jgi:hypothetical protein